MHKSINKIRRKTELQLSRGGIWAQIETVLRSCENMMWKTTNKCVVECLGDSHAGIFRKLNTYHELKEIRFRAISVKGATAFGIANPNSKTNSFKIFDTWLQRFDEKKPLLFMMGEVDTGFLIWWRAQKYKKEPYALLDEAVANYTAFLSETKKTHPMMIVCAAPLPTIRDGEILGEIANLRKEVTATQHERTQMTLTFNQRIKQWCEQNKVLFIDLDSVSLDDTTKLVKSELLNKNPADHHYDDNAFADMLLREMKEQNILKQIQNWCK